MFGVTRAMTRALLGDREAALQSLRDSLNGVNQGTWWYVFGYEPAFDGLREDPRFVALRHQAEVHVAEQREHLRKLRAAGTVPARGAVSH